MVIRPASACLSALLVVTSVVSSASTAIALPTRSNLTAPQTPPPMPASLPGLVSRRIQRDLSQRLNVSTQSISVGEATVRTWSDSCLGLPQANERCQTSEVQGWEVEVNSEQQRWLYRSDRIGQRLRLTDADSPQTPANVFSSQLSRRLLTVAAEQIGQPASTLQILSMQPAQWKDGCLGISEPDAICTQATVQGLRAIVSNGSRGPEEWAFNNPGPREWVYHLSADGTRIVQNTLASEAKDYTGTYFISPRRTPVVSSALPSPIVFQSFTTFDGIDLLTLTEDGKVYFERQNDRRPDEEIAPEVVHQISSERVVAFKQLLQQQRFSNFSGTDYSNEDPSIATHGGYSMTDAQSIVSTSTESEQLPENLRTIASAWEEIAVFFR